MLISQKNYLLVRDTNSLNMLDSDLTQPFETLINIGDKVCVDLNLDTAQKIQVEYGGWIQQMEKVNKFIERFLTSKYEYAYYFVKLSEKISIFIFIIINNNYNIIFK